MLVKGGDGKQDPCAPFIYLVYKCPPKHRIVTNPWTTTIAIYLYDQNGDSGIPTNGLIDR